MAIQATTSNSVSVSNSDTGGIISGVGSVVLTVGTATKCADLTIPPSTVNHPLDFPLGVTTAQFVYVKAVAGTDFKVSTGLSGETVFDIPEGGAWLVYNVDGAFISSVNGGTIQFIVGG